MARRTSGEGSITKRDDGRWSVLLSNGMDADGKRLRRSTTCRTQKEARETLKTWIRERDAGLDSTKGARTLTVAELMDEFLTFSRNKGLRPKTLRNYEQLARLHIVPGLGHLEVRLLDAWTITKFLTTRQKVADNSTGKLSPRTIRQMRVVLRSALEIARKRKVIVTNPADDAEAPPLERYEAKSLTVEQASRLLGVLDKYPFGTFYCVMLGLGMRPGEIRGLRWSDIEFARDAGTGWLTVSRQVQRVDGVQRAMPVKTQKGNRRVALPGFVARSLRSHQDKQREELTAFREAGVERPILWSDLVFQNGEGNPVEERHVARRFHQLTEQLCLPHIRLYDLRRTCVTFLHAMGVPANVIKDIVGHSQISVTMDYYTDTHDPSRGEAARILDAALGKQFGGEQETHGT